MQFVSEKIEIICRELYAFANRKICDISMEYAPCEGYKTSNKPPKTGWMPFPAGARVQGRDSHYWFRCSLRTPKLDEKTGCYVKFITGYEGQWDACNPQGLVYANGEMVQGCDTNHTQVFLEGEKDYTLHNYFYLGLTDNWVPLEASLCTLDLPTEQLYYDIKVALDCCKLQHPNTDEYISVLTLLEQTVNLLDLRKPGDANYYASLAEATAFIRDRLYDKLCSTEGKPVIACLGHTHIDVEWLWARAQTREKIQRSFATAATLMERYPE